MSRLFKGAAGALAVLTLAGLAILWPAGHTPLGVDIGVTSEKAKVLDVEETFARASASAAASSCGCGSRPGRTQATRRE